MRVPVSERQSESVVNEAGCVACLQKLAVVETTTVVVVVDRHSGGGGVVIVLRTGTGSGVSLPGNGLWEDDIAVEAAVVVIVLISGRG